MKQHLFDYSQSFIKYLKSTDFSKAILLGISVSIPIVLGIQLGHLEVGLSIAFGAMWCSPSNTNGSHRHNVISILWATLLVMVISLIGGYLNLREWYMLPVLGIVTFSVAYLAIFGFRASLIGFSGLLALVLSFAYEAKEIEVYEHCLWIGVGGLWYLGLIIIWHHLNPRAQTEETLSEIYQLTASFLKTRGKLIDSNSDQLALRSNLAKQQDKLIELHGTLRDILIKSRKDAGPSIYQNKRLLVFAQLVEILEVALANPVEYDKMNVLFSQKPSLASDFQGLIFEIANQLQYVGNSTPKKALDSKNKLLEEQFKKVRSTLEILESEISVEHYLMLHNLIEYQEKQFEKLKKIKWLLEDPHIDENDYINTETALKFIPHQDYSPRLLIDNLNMRSHIFRHSLRLAVVMILGFSIGSFLDFQNPYWILLTIIVIMRPTYGLTKERTKERIIGTLIGSLIAVSVVFFIKSPYVFGILGVVSLVLAFSIVQKNYRIAATFITLSVVFIYGIIRPDILSVIQFRILDTVFGAVLSFLAIYYLWPSWSFLKIEDAVIKSVSANKDFLEQIILFYDRKGEVPIEYKIARKRAFDENSNLSTAFQDMTQEPSSKQIDYERTYELVVHNHRILTSLASLSGYIQNQTTTSASNELKEVANLIENNLDHTIQILKKNKNGSETMDNEIKFKQLHRSLNNSIEATPPNDRTRRRLQEAHLILEQLHWLFSLSSKLVKLASRA